MQQKLAKAFHYGSWVLLASLVIQFFFAGVMLFGVARLGSTPHLIMALFIHGLSFALLGAAVAAKLGRRAVVFSGLFFVLMFVQGGLMHLGSVSNVFMALHPMNATFLLYVGYKLATLQVQPQEVKQAAIKSTAELRQVKVSI
jgi:hypothetical protein